MNLICGVLQNTWTKFYNSCVRNLDSRTKILIGAGLIVAALLTFVLCTKGHNKSAMVNSWFLFWVSIILFIVAVFYLVNV